jgi:pyridoxamine 5'-phosphate oxidase
MNEATAMTLSTVAKTGAPSSRVVLLKGLTETGFVFYTSYSSKKASEIAANSLVALNFYWPQTFKQVKIVGSITKTSREVSEQYWNSRPKESQISQALSDQSQPIDSRAELEKRHNDLLAQYQSKDLPCPENWGGYEVSPSRVEFWIGTVNRLHDRLVAEKTNENWSWTRLQP